MIDIDKIFDNFFNLPVFARFEYLVIEQEKSKFSKETFLKVLFDRWKLYKHLVYEDFYKKDFDSLVNEYGWEYTAITIYGDDFEPFDHLYSEEEIDEINLFVFQDNIPKPKWLNESTLFLLHDYISDLNSLWFEKKKSSSVKPIPNNTFGFKKKKRINLLLSVITELTKEFDFLNLDKCSFNDAINVFTTDDYKTEQSQIHSGCKTILFTHIIKQIKPHFNNLTAFSVSNSGLFFPKNSLEALKISNYQKRYEPSDDESKKINTIINLLNN